MKLMSLFVMKVLVLWIAVVGLLSQAPLARGEVELLHTFGSSVAHEAFRNHFTVKMRKLLQEPNIL